MADHDACMLHLTWLLTLLGYGLVRAMCYVGLKALLPSRR